MDRDTRVGIFDIGFVSSLGIGKEALTSYISSSEKISENFLQDSYDPEGFLGKKGLRYLNNGTKLISSMYFQLLKNNLLDHYIQEHSERIGVYNGTELINLYDDFEFDLVAKNEGPSYVSPMKAPNTLANVASSFFSMKAGITGPNTTLSGGYNGSLEALNLSSIHLQENMVDLALVGSVEISSKYHKPFISDSTKKTELAIGCVVGTDKARDNLKLPPKGYLVSFSSCAIVTTVTSAIPNLIASVLKAAGLSKEEIDCVYVCDKKNTVDYKIFEKLLPSIKRIMNLSIIFPNCNNALPLLSISSFILDLEISSSSILYQEGNIKDCKNALIFSFEECGYCTAAIVTREGK